jgi:hypothetical protein
MTGSIMVLIYCMSICGLMRGRMGFLGRGLDISDGIETLDLNWGRVSHSGCVQPGITAC